MHLRTECCARACERPKSQDLGKYARMACKPDSVQGLPLWMTIPLALRLLAGSSRQPGSLGAKFPCRHPLPGRRTIPIRRCSRWGLPCQVCYQPRGGLLPHRFTLTAPRCGGLFSVALSVGLPRPGVTRHRHFMESGLSSGTQLSAKRSYGHSRSSGHPRIAADRQSDAAGQSPKRARLATRVPTGTG